MINISIVEDSKADASLLIDYIHKFLEGVGESVTVQHYQSGLAFLESYEQSTDVVFMDIELPDLDGMETSKRLRKLDREVIIVFVTNMAQFAVDGYQVDALDFVLKPINYYSFALRMNRVLEHLKHSSKELKLSVKSENGVYCIPVSTLKYVEVVKHDVIYHTDKQDITVRGSMKDVETELENAGFFKCNRCYLVNLKYVMSIEENTVMVGNTPLQISRPRRKEFLSAIAAYFGAGGGYR